MNSQLLVLACAVLGALAWAPREEAPQVVYKTPQVVAVPQVVAPAPVVTQVVAAPQVAAHRHRYTGSLLLSKAQAVLNSDDATYGTGYGYDYRPTVFSAPDRVYHVGRYLSGHGPAPFFAPPHVSYPGEGGYLRYRLFNDAFNRHADGQFLADHEEQERRQILADERRHNLENYLRHEADEAKLREFGRFARLNDYLHRREEQAEFGALLTQVEHKRREYVFGLVFQMIKFCKCRDDIVDLHRYFSGSDVRNGSYYNNNQDNVFGNDAGQLFGLGGAVPIPRTPEQARRWFMRGLVNTICDSSKYYVDKVRKIAAQQGFFATVDNLVNGQPNNNINNNSDNNDVNNNGFNNNNNGFNNNNNLNNNGFNRNINNGGYNTNYNANSNNQNNNYNYNKNYNPNSQ